MKQRNRFAFAARVGLCLALLWGVGCDRIVDTMMQRGIQQRTESVRTDLLEDDALNVFFCGTGAPLPVASSAGACTLVLAGGQLYVVDVGPGSQEVAQIAGMPTAALDGVFLTHFHSDHIGELGEWAMQSWVAGRDQPLDVYGPQGVDHHQDHVRTSGLGPAPAGREQGQEAEDQAREVLAHGPECSAWAGPGTKVPIVLAAR